MIMLAYSDFKYSLIPNACIMIAVLYNRIEDYTLQVSGEENYIAGKNELLSFKHIRKYETLLIIHSLYHCVVFGTW